ncbi:MAG: hypothetical protein JSU07_02200 [Bacteroidetes bacterium]|nr:hypothetical protein [Bacteroidota bacterium]
MTRNHCYIYISECIEFRKERPTASGNIVLLKGAFYAKNKLGVHDKSLGVNIETFKTISNNNRYKKEID